MDKLKAGIVGATGAIGQQFVESLAGHPWFEIDSLYASEMSAGKRYGKALEGRVYGDIPEDIQEMRVHKVDDLFNQKLDLCFSGLETGVGRELEPKFAEHAHLFSTSSAFRYVNDVPILIPEVNPKHAELIKRQRKDRGWKSLTTISNCTTKTLVVPLKPIYDKFGIEELHVTSMQALSGAGDKGIREGSEYRKIASKNVIPFIESEESKVSIETKKILGEYDLGIIWKAKMRIYPHCTRVDVEDGHMETVSIKTKKPWDIKTVKKILGGFMGLPQELKLPSAPEKPIELWDDPDPKDYATYRPQPKLDANAGGGMMTSVGRVREVEDNICFVTSSHNTKAGGAKAAVMNAEFLFKKGYLEL